MPVLRARVTGVSGRVTNLESFEDVRARGSLGREYTITYRDNLEANERIVDGAFWHGRSPDPEVSIERGLHERFAHQRRRHRPLRHPRPDRSTRG